jgi:hypothetical protein
MLMMIKRSNRGKLSGSLGGKALPDMRRGAQYKQPKRGLLYSLVLGLVFALALGTLPATAEAAISGAPAHEKSAKINDDGTVDITLNVTGAVDHSSESSKADVIVVLDLSGSMNAVPNPYKNKVYFSNKTLNGNTRKVKYFNSRRTFWDYYPAGWYYEDNPYESYDDDLFYSTTNEPTRLDTAKSAVKSLVHQLLANNSSHPNTVNVSLVTFNNTATVKQVLTNNETDIDDAVSSLSADGGTNWEDALKTASGITTREGASASVVFVSDGDPTFRNTKGDGDYSNLTPKGLWGSGYDDPNGDNYKYALDQAKTIVGKKWELYSVAAFGNVSNMQRLVEDAGEQVDGHYFPASDSASLNAAFDSIVKSITTTVSYTNVSIHDALSQSVSYVLPDGAKEPTFTYQKNGELWTPTTPAKVENGSVVWNVGDLEQNVIYSVTFKVKINQAAYDAAAPKDGVEAVTSVKTNSDDEAKDYVQYQIKTDVNGTPTTSDPATAKYESPTVNVPTSTLHISKTWDRKGWDSVSVPSELKVQIKQNDKPYKTVTLNSRNDWKADVVVAAGPDGHTYSVVENALAGWDATLPGDVMLQGLAKQEGKQAITNTIKTSKLTIKKSVSGNFGDTSKGFSFKLTDASNAAIVNAQAAEGTSEDVNLANDGTFTLKNGRSLVVELPYGATYSVVENDPKDTNDTVDYTTSINVGNSGATTDESARKASSPKDGITKDTTITYTNNRDVTPDVGVDLGSGAPYVAVVGGIGVAGVIWMALKRRNRQGI